MSSIKNNVLFFRILTGLGVYWLHVRFDAKPKYYNYRDFTMWDPDTFY